MKSLAVALVLTLAGCNVGLPDKVDKAVDSIDDVNVKLDQCLDGLTVASKLLEECVNKECPDCSCPLDCGFKYYVEYLMCIPKCNEMECELECSKALTAGLHNCYS